MVQHRHGPRACGIHLAHAALNRRNTALASKPFIVTDMNAAEEGWNEPDGRGVLKWQTLVDNETTPSQGLTAGIVHLAPGDFLALHRHPPAEIYHVIEGSAVVSLDGVERRIGVGDTVYVAPNCEHGIRNDGERRMRFFYVFPTDSLDGVSYEFTHRST
jgi:quercetin dioxygenase-like cupin family protein